MYDFKSVEEKWRKYWKEKAIFLYEGKSDKQIFIIDTPPPFTNGELHMGQAFWVSYIDSIARYKRMTGHNVLYPQGWDAHGFPTEMAVEKKHGKRLSRDEFYKKCVEESVKNIATMKQQMLNLGATFDERYEYLTISDDYLAKVQLSVIEMYEKGMVYRAHHPVEWCVNCVTTISREQAEEREEETTLNYINFKIKGTQRAIMIATTRPELMHATVAVAVNPTDPKMSKLVGKTVIVPLVEREVPIIADESVEKDFGTGAEMVSTFGDKQDVALYYKHKLEFVESMDENGVLKNAGKFTGTHVKDAREPVVAALDGAGALKKREKMRHTLKIHDRCKTPVELISSMQWFMKTKENAQKIKEVAAEIRWVPEFGRQRLDDWSNFIEWDWAISRNRVFGTPIPFWYCTECGQVVPADKKKLPVDPVKHQPPVQSCPRCKGNLAGEKNTLDGWVDSSITPLVISGWPQMKDERAKGFPTALRIQGTDIIRTWAFYTIFRTWAITGNKPWASIIAHAMVLGTDGREMHKSEGNGLSPQELIDKYGTDPTRMWVALSGAIVKDKPFSYQDMDFAKSFSTKLYNTANFVKLALEKGKLPKEEPHKDLNAFDVWILNRFNTTVKEVTEAYDSYALYEAMSKIVNFYWHEFADYYIESVKHRVYSEDKKTEKSKSAALFTLRYICTNSIKLLAPVIPHICEEINFMFSERSVFLQEWPKHAQTEEKPDYVINGLVFKSGIIDVTPESVGEMLNGIVSDVRKQKAASRIALNKEISSINIKVPDEYYNAIEYSKGELAGILKAGRVSVSKGEYSVDVKI